MTLAAIVKTAVINRVPAGSRIIGALMLVGHSSSSLHSIMVVVAENLMIKAARKATAALMERVDTIAVSMVKGVKALLTPQVRVLIKLLLQKWII